LALLVITIYYLIIAD